jgi:hypothetical protein
MPASPAAIAAELDELRLIAKALDVDEVIDFDGVSDAAELRKRILDLAADRRLELRDLKAKPRPTEPRGNLIAALAAAQAAFPPIPKTKTATVKVQESKGGGSYSYQYADLADVLTVVRPVLAAEGLAVYQQTTYESERRLLLTTTLEHVSGASLVSTIVLTASPDSPQAFGGALTYLRRYELVTLLGIQADEDADAHNVAQPEDRRDVPSDVSPPWTREASEPRKAQLLEALEPMLGKDGARTLAMGAKSSLGYVPDVLVAFARSLRQAMDAAAAMTEEEREVARRAQDAAVERADTPSPEPTGDPGPDPTAAPVADTPPEQTVAEYMTTRPVEELRQAAADHPRDDVRAAAAAELERRGATVEEPEPGSVKVPELPKDPAQAFGVLKAAGCKCVDPLRQRSEQGDYDPTCPIDGHGVPF